MDTIRVWAVIFAAQKIACTPSWDGTKAAKGEFVCQLIDGAVHLNQKSVFAESGLLRNLPVRMKESAVYARCV
jgi:hypothetical protein